MGRSVCLSPAVPEEIPAIARAMRREDKREVYASHGATPRQALEQSLADSVWAYTIYDELDDLGMFGVADAGGGCGSPWLLATPRLFRDYPLAFARGSRAIVARMRNEFTSLENWVHAENLTSVKWLRWLGFTIHPAVYYGFHPAMFHRFTWRR